MTVERMATVYVRIDDFLVEANCRTENGVWISAEPVTQLVRSASTSELGAAVRSALAASRRGVPHPLNWDEFPSSLLRVANVRDWNALQQSAAQCKVKEAADSIEFVPSWNGGTRGDQRGYHSLDELAVTVSGDATDDALGDAVLAAWMRCRK